MPDQNSQENIQEMTAEDAKASMGISSRLVEQMLQAQGQQAQPEAVEGSQTPESAPQQTETPQTQETAPVEETPQESQDIEEPNEMEEMKKGMDEFKGEVKGIIESKFDDLTKTIRESLKD